MVTSAARLAKLGSLQPLLVQLGKSQFGFQKRGVIVCVIRSANADGWERASHCCNGCPWTDSNPDKISNLGMWWCDLAGGIVGTALHHAVGVIERHLDFAGVIGIDGVSAVDPGPELLVRP